jgi:hypothetical protein
VFTPPVTITWIKIVSGNKLHLSDILVNATVELLLEGDDDLSNNFERLSDNFLVVGSFDSLGHFSSNFSFEQVLRCYKTFFLSIDGMVKIS